MELTVLESVDAVGGVKDEWTSLLTRASDPDPFASPDWLLAWWEAFAHPSWRMQLVLLREQGGALVGVVPLYVSKERRWGRPAQVLKFWQNPYSNRVAPIVSAEIAREAITKMVSGLYSNLTAEWDVADLGPMVSTNQTTRYLVAELNSGRRGSASVEGYASPYRDLPKSQELLERSLSTSFRKSLRRKVNKSGRANTRVEFSSDPRRLADALDISQDTWQHEARTGIGSSRAVKEFYEHVTEGFGESGQLQLAFLYVDGSPIAFELNLTFARTVYNLKVGYRAEYSHLSPGIVLRHSVLCHAIDQGYEEFDFLGASEGYKLHWASGVRPHVNILFVRRRSYWWIPYVLRYASKSLLETRFSWVLQAKRRLQERLKTSTRK